MKQGVVPAKKAPPLTAQFPASRLPSSNVLHSPCTERKPMKQRLVGTCQWTSRPRTYFAQDCNCLRMHNFGCSCVQRMPLIFATEKGLQEQAGLSAVVTWSSDSSSCPVEGVLCTLSQQGEGVCKARHACADTGTQDWMPRTAYYRDAQDRLLWRDKTCPART